MSKSIMISYLSTSLDGGTSEKRLTKWRPNPGVATASEPPIDRLILLYEKRDEALATLVEEDAKRMRSDFDVQLIEMPLSPPSLNATYMTLLRFANDFQFDRAHRYYLNITTCTPIQLMCFCTLAATDRWPVRLVECLDAKTDDLASKVELIDPDLSRYDAILNQYPLGNAAGIEVLKGNIVTHNNAYNEMVVNIQATVLRSRSPILLTGPSGSGKTAMARRVHQVRARSNLVVERFVEVNCIALKDISAMSALFGHKDGALIGFTGSAKGELRFAHEGILFLDNIDELGLSEQAVLLQVMEDKLVTPLGSRAPVKCDFQLIAASNKNLHELVKKGQFRTDLLARLSTWEFRMPSLRDRPEDIESNLAHEIRKSTNQLPDDQRFSAKALKQYLAFATSDEALWTANFRDLSASVERMITRSVDGVISEVIVDTEIHTLRAKWRAPGASGHLEAERTTSSSSDKSATVDYVSIVLPAHELNLFEQNQLNYVIGVALTSNSYADLSRRIYGEDAGTNPAQKSRSYLIGYGLNLEMIKATVKALGDRAIERGDENF
ncbi:transcriptional regulatory protein RtcR [Pseudomonas sp. PvP027]|jgi:transcriptional regulatory protein RtcR|uniref:RNA repair transcriptional activator RtcR family protein n=1 Tax=Pseudomonas sp. PvP027 TaxID=2806587 RepID=UPI0001E29A50|nr:RNA repair transcriptional activator RtcR family protein [Pseudomonas sp. PvP027]MBP1143224.1 transcriptional regulatory protein RtcR [Pseudomonas sp. PvP027]